MENKDNYTHYEFSCEVSGGLDGRATMRYNFSSKTQRDATIFTEGIRIALASLSLKLGNSSLTETAEAIPSIINTKWIRQE
jgi:hypothetical protein